jgi:two-component system phosphate regulon response regulator PhoB
MNKILVIDDAKDCHLLLRKAFDADCVLTSVFNLENADKALLQNEFDLILLDIVLPDGDGLEFCARIRTSTKSRDVPIIFLTGKSDLAAKSIGFSLGAEDYIIKPFDPLEVKIRCFAKITKKIVKNDRDSLHRIGDLRFEIPSQRVFIRQESGERQLALTPTGFKLLLFLSQNESHVFTRDQLISSVWGQGTFIVDRVVDTHIGAIRKELIGSEISIQAVRGHGYKLTRSDAI